MKKWFVLLLLLLIPASLSAGEFPEIAEWKPLDAINIHRQNDLWKYINGAAELFITYDFQVLRFRDFAKGDMEMTVEIYDMATPLNAFGIYTIERSDDVKRLSIGTEAVIELPYYCQLLKDRYYVKVKMQMGELDHKSGEAILRSIEAYLDGRPVFPDELNDLPARNKISGTEKYIARGYMGTGELNNILLAYYQDAKGKEYRYFLLLPSTDETVDIKWHNLSEKWKSVDEKGHAILYRDIPYEGKVGIVRKDQMIIGVSHVFDMEDMLKRLTDAL